jgi:ring-1,2-phenylacetyl-CoA epoxidase subunit PaaD
MEHSTERAVWQALEQVFDPEIPKLSIVDLGVITNVRVDADRVAHITMTPTFSGCPALHVMKDDITHKVGELAQQGVVSGVQVEVSFEVAWNSNRITDKGREILHTMGFAPPPRLEGEEGKFYVPLEVLSDVACPHCGSRNTTLQTPFGPTLCRAIHYCNSCHQAFEQFKPLA